ncbi:hypothetical protein WG936_11020 [Corynebacterium sp. H127]|uniref:hypothetical protein n=1 Tax=Corynebacterium sp. H127 TaxID=3133418 RepID=UPI0030A3BAB0
MEIWQLNHPKLGLIEVERGFDEEFREHYPDWPAAPSEKPFTHLDADANLKQRMTAWVRNPPARVQIKVAGIPMSRIKKVPKAKFPLQEKDLSKLADGDAVTIPGKPQLEFVRSAFDEILSISYREGAEIVEFDPPPGSRGAKRKQAMAESSFKRMAFPLLAGLGKSGWAISVLVLGPLVGRLITWILGFLPDLNVPQISLPKLPELPELPKPPYIALPYPHWSLPGISFPQLPELPAWVLFLMEYSKVWVPVIVGIFLAIMAIRNHKKSERIKREWENRRDQQPEETSGEQT